MHSHAALIIIYGLIAAGANLAGGLLVSARRVGQATLRYLIALGSGFMLAAVFLKILPESLDLWRGRTLQPMGCFLGGYLLIQFFEHTVAPHFHFGAETHEDAMLHHHAALAGIGALMIHTLFDGVSIAVGFLVSFQLGVIIFLAIILHKLPEGFTVASMMLASGAGRRKALGAAALVGLATFGGVGLVVLVHGLAFDSQTLSAYALPVSAGVTLYVAASDLIPEVNRREGGLKTSMLVFGGVGVFYLAEVVVERLAG